MNSVNIGLVGAGTIGCGVYRTISEKRVRCREKDRHTAEFMQDSGYRHRKRTSGENTRRTSHHRCL